MVLLFEVAHFKICFGVYKYIENSARPTAQHRLKCWDAIRGTALCFYFHASLVTVKIITRFYASP